MFGNKGIFIPFRVFGSMIWLLLSLSLRIRISKKHRLVASDLLNKLTYRLNKSAASDRVIGFRMLIRFVKLVAKQRKPAHWNASVLIFDGRKNSAELRKRYVSWHTGLQIGRAHV